MAAQRARYSADVSFNVQTNVDVACMPGVPSSAYIRGLQVKAFGTIVSIKGISPAGDALVRGGLNIDVDAMDQLARNWLRDRGMLE